MSLLNILPDALEYIGEKVKRKPPVEEPSALDKVWKAQREEEKAAHDRRKSKPKAPAVMAFGRFNPPTTGHARLVQTVKQMAASVGALPVLFTSTKQDAENPLPYAVKVGWLKRLFPGVQVVDNPDITHPVKALALLQSMGFDVVTVVVGSDQTKEFERIADYCKRKGVKSENSRFKPLTNVQVLTVQGERDGRTFGVEGMSASKLRKAAKAKNFLAFKRGVPTKSEAVARKLYFQVRKGMGLTKGHAFLLCGYSLNSANALRETFGQMFPRVKAFDARTNALMQHAKPFFMDLSGYNNGQVSGLCRSLAESNYKTTIYVVPAPLPKQITEGWLKSQATVGLIKQRTNAVVVEDAACALAHARRTIKEEGEAGKPKQPSDVDRLKLRQKQELLATKQRQSNDLLQTKQRDLQKKSREDQQKLAQSAKPKAKE